MASSDMRTVSLDSRSDRTDSGLPGIQKPNNKIANIAIIVGFLGLLATAICASVIKPSDLSNVNMNNIDIAAGGAVLSLTTIALGIIARKKPIVKEVENFPEADYGCGDENGSLIKKDADKDKAHNETGKGKNCSVSGNYRSKVLNPTNVTTTGSTKQETPAKKQETPAKTQETPAKTQETPAEENTFISEGFMLFDSNAPQTEIQQIVKKRQDARKQLAEVQAKSEVVTNFFKSEFSTNKPDLDPLVFSNSEKSSNEEAGNQTGHNTVTAKGKQTGRKGNQTGRKSNQ